MDMAGNYLWGGIYGDCGSGARRPSEMDLVLKIRGALKSKKLIKPWPGFLREYQSAGRFIARRVWF